MILLRLLITEYLAGLMLWISCTRGEIKKLKKSKVSIGEKFVLSIVKYSLTLSLINFSKILRIFGIEPEIFFNKFVKKSTNASRSISSVLSKGRHLFKGATNE